MADAGRNGELRTFVAESGDAVELLQSELRRYRPPSSSDEE